MTRPIRVMAHRGSSEDVPEHTLAAYLKALADGADGLECDVRLTADGHLVCVHDRRIDRTSTGVGIVSTLELAELAHLDWGAWHSWDLDDEAPDDLTATEAGGRHGILTLDRLLDVVTSWDRRVEVAIETKHPTRYAGLVERRLVEVLHRYGLAHPRLGADSPVRVMSFSPQALRRVRRLAPSLRTVLLLDRRAQRLRGGMLPLKVSAAGPGIDLVRAHPAWVGRLRRAGAEVHVWTVDAAADVELCADLDVDVIITNRPGATRRRLARRGLATTTPGERPERSGP